MPSSAGSAGGVEEPELTEEGGVRSSPASPVDSPADAELVGRRTGSVGSVADSSPPVALLLPAVAAGPGRFSYPAGGRLPGRRRRRAAGRGGSGGGGGRLSWRRRRSSWTSLETIRRVLSRCRTARSRRLCSAAARVARRCCTCAWGDPWEGGIRGGGGQRVRGVTMEDE